MLLPLDGKVCNSTEVNNSIFGSYMSKQVSYTQQMYVLGDCHSHTFRELFPNYWQISGWGRQKKGHRGFALSLFYFLSDGPQRKTF